MSHFYLGKVAHPWRDAPNYAILSAPSMQSARGAPMAHWDFFENLNEFVSVVDMDTHGIVYLNRRLRELCGAPEAADYQGLPCYELLQNCGSPCAMCNDDQLEPGKFQEWWYYNPVWDKNLAVKDTMVAEDGHRYRVEVAIDIAPQEWRGALVPNDEGLQALVNEALRQALRQPDPDSSISVCLEYLGRTLGADRTYVFERNERGNSDNTYEWVAAGVAPEMDTLQDVPAEVCAQWYQSFSDGRPIAIHDLDDIRSSDPLMYQCLARQDIHSLFVVPLFEGDRTLGFYGVDNPSGRHVEHGADILQLIAHYIVAAIRRRDLIRQLRQEEQERAQADMERQLAEELARRTQENLDLVNDIIGNGLWYMNFDENGQMTSVFWSQAFRKMLGFHDEGDFPNTLEAWTDRIHPDARARVEEAYWRTVTDDVPYDEVYELQKANGTYEWFRDQGRVMRYPNGQPRLFLGTFINITEERNSRQAIEDALEAANQANAAKTKFLSSMSHDIRTPLNAIIGMTAIARTSKDDPDKVNRCLEQIATSSRHLLGLVNEVLDMNRIESGVVNLNSAPFNLAQLVADFLSTARALVTNKGLDFEVDVADIAHPLVVGDKERLHQCLMNFLGNAVKYTPVGGSVRFRAREVPTNRVDRGCFEFAFEDTGIGMTQDFIDHRLFEPFLRADDERAIREQGAGLGMPITKNIVEMMNGHVTVTSTLNEGSSFVATVFFALQDADEAADPVTGQGLEVFEGVDFSGKRLLLVEDNALNAEISKEILGMTNVTVDHVWNGQEACETLESCEDGAYDLVFMDIQMPGINGLDAARRIRGSERPYLQTVPMVAMSANAFAEDAQRSLEAGMDGHLSKPLDFGALLRVLRAHLG